LTYCLYRDPRVPPRNKGLLAAALVAAWSPLIDVPLWVPVLGEMDALAISVLAIRLFVEKAPPEVVREHQERIALGTSTFDQDMREGLATARARTRRFWPRRQMTT
jgi:uncharacterized membrane protein YkvA (DUF1232 family)